MMEIPMPSDGRFNPCSKSSSSPTINIKELSQPSADYNDFNISPDVWINWANNNTGLLNIAPSISPYATQLKAEPLTPPSMASSAKALPTDSLDTSPDMLIDTSIDFQDGIEEPLFPSPLPTPQELTFHAHGPGLQAYSEQSWNSPQPMTRHSSSATSQSQQQQQSYFYPTLSHSEEANLRAIAMPSLPSSSMSSSPDDSLLSSPSGRGMRSRKRKSSPLTEEEDEGESPDSAPRPPVKKTAHNMIEKRYRTNLNDKIAALRQSVPSLRVTESSLNGASSRRGGDVMEDLDGLTPANKLNKATILSKATEYIGHLERRNQALIREKKGLYERISAFEALIMGRKYNGPAMYQPDLFLLQHNRMMSQSGQQGHGGRRSTRQQIPR